MKTEESTPIAVRISKADIMQFQERKAWYEECKRNTIPCTIEDIDFTEETKHEIWLTFLYSPLKRYIVEGKVVIHPDVEQRTEILMNNSQVNHPDSSKTRKKVKRESSARTRTRCACCFVKNPSSLNCHLFRCSCRKYGIECGERFPCAGKCNDGIKLFES